MTQNQIAYWKLEEDKRHNLMSESADMAKANAALSQAAAAHEKNDVSRYQAELGLEGTKYTADSSRGNQWINAGSSVFGSLAGGAARIIANRVR